MKEAFEKIQNGHDPVEDEREDNGSDSAPSDDNIDLHQLYDIIYCQRKNSKKILANRFQEEKKFEKDFEALSKLVKNRIREASKESRN